MVNVMTRTAAKRTGLPDHLSFTQARLWLRCQRQHWYRYGLGLVEPPPGALVLGGAVHRALEHHNRRKAETRRDAPWEVVSDVYAEAFRELGRDADWKGEQPDQVKDRGYAALRRYHQEAAPHVQPASSEDIERHVVAPLLDSCTLHVVVDVVDACGTIIDYKTSAKAVHAIPDETRLQLWLYHAALRAQEPARQPAGLAAHYMIAKANAPAPALLEAPAPDPRELDWWLRALDTIRLSMERAYQDQHFLPASPGSWVCSPRWCAYWDRCRRDW